MFFKTFNRISDKLIFVLSLIMIGFTILYNVITLPIDSQELESTLEKNLIQELDLLSGSLSKPLWDLDFSSIDSIINASAQKEEIVGIMVYDESGYLLKGVQKPELQGIQMRTEIKEIMFGIEEIGSVELSTTSKYARLRLGRNKLRGALMMTTLTLTVILLLHRMVEKELLPLSKLEKVADKIAGGELSNPIEKMGNLQIRHLQYSVDRMQQSLFEKQIQIHTKMRQLEEAVETTNQAYKDTVFALAKAVEANDTYTAGHCERVSDFSVMLAKCLGLKDEEINDIELGAILHDIGKIGIPSTVLNKPGRLTDEEFELIKQHPNIGYEIIKDVGFLHNASKIMLMHHERYDGKGYPRGLSGDEILIGAKILSVVDSYDAMTSQRSYRKVPLTMKEAIDELKKGAGYQYDAGVVSCFVEIIQTSEGGDSI